MDQETGPDTLFGAIDKRGEEERRTIRGDADTRCRQVLAEADSRIEALKAEAMRGLERELAGDRQRLLGEARMKARAEGLRVKRRLIAEAFARAGKEIERLRASPPAAEVLKSLAAEAAAAVGQPCTVETSAAEGTAVAASPDGSRRADNSLSSRLKRAQVVDESEVARRLFPQLRQERMGKQGE
jgi:vacuolar-type H+-ATPase subunit E/Vma4